MYSCLPSHLLPMLSPPLTIPKPLTLLMIGQILKLESFYHQPVPVLSQLTGENVKIKLKMTIQWLEMCIKLIAECFNIIMIITLFNCLIINKVWYTHLHCKSCPTLIYTSRINPFAPKFFKRNNIDHWHIQPVGFGWAQAHSHQFTEGGDSWARSARLSVKCGDMAPGMFLNSWVPELAFPAF